MKARVADLPADLALPVTAALQSLGAEVVTQPGADCDLLVLTADRPEAALAQIAAFAAQAPQADRHGADLRAGAQVIWLFPAGMAEVLTGPLRQAALAHAPQLRVNGLHLAPRRPKPEPWQAAWFAAQRHPGPLPPAEALAVALRYLLGAASVTGQVLHLPPPVSPL